MTAQTRPDVTIVLLAGGLATRLPGKLAMRIGDETMLARATRQLSRAGYPIVVSVRTPMAEMPDEQQIVDRYVDKGPLGGLASAAACVTTSLLFAAAADLPNLDERAVAACVARFKAALADEVLAPEAVTPRHADGSIEPLASLYNTQGLRLAAQAAIARGKLRVSAALSGLRTVYVEVAAVEESRYHNVNTAEDFERIR